jgi:hypothetical protein
MPASVMPGTVKTSSADIRGYQLSNDKMLCQYLVHRTDQTVPVTGVFDTLALPFDSGKGFWMDPATGDTLALIATDPGTRAVSIPDFYADIALKIWSTAGPAVEKRPAAPAVNVLVRPNPFNPGTTLIRFSGPPLGAKTRLVIVDVRGRTVQDLSRDIRDNRVAWDTGARASGLYVAVLTYGKTVIRKKLVLLR